MLMSGHRLRCALDRAPKGEGEPYQRKDQADQTRCEKFQDDVPGRQLAADPKHDRGDVADG